MLGYPPASENPKIYTFCRQEIQSYMSSLALILILSSSETIQITTLVSSSWCAIWQLGDMTEVIFHLLLQENFLTNVA